MKGNSVLSADQTKVRVLVVDDHPVVRHGIIANVTPQRDMTVILDGQHDPAGTIAQGNGDSTGTRVLSHVTQGLLRDTI